MSLAAGVWRDKLKFVHSHSILMHYIHGDVIIISISTNGVTYVSTGLNNLLSSLIGAGGNVGGTAVSTDRGTGIWYSY